MTFQEYVDKFLDEISVEKALSFEKADEFVNKITKLKYESGASLSVEDQIQLIEMLNETLKKRGYGVKAIIQDSVNSSTVTAISSILSQIKQKKDGDKR